MTHASPSDAEDRDPSASAPESAGRAALLALAALLCIITLALPAVGVVMALLRAPPTSSEPAAASSWSADLLLLVRTLLIAAIIAVSATILAFPAAWSMRRISTRAAAMLITPLLLPSYLVYASWGLLRAPGSALAAFIERDAPHRAPIAAAVQAVGGLALWAWPLAALVLAAGARRIDQGALDAARLTQASPWRRALLIAGAMRAAILSSIGVVLLVMLGSAIPLHVAQVETYSIAIWRRLDESAGAPSVWWSALPLLAIAAAAGWFISGRILADHSSAPPPPIEPDRGVSAGWILAAIVVWSLSTLLPLVLFLTHLREARSLAGFWRESAVAVESSSLLAAIVGALAILIALATSLGLSAPVNSLARRAAALTLRLWLIAALAPGVLIGSALRAVSNTAPTAWISDTRFGVLIAHLARFGAVAALIGCWLARQEPRDLIEQRRLAGPDSLAGWLTASAPLQAGALLAAGAAVAALSLHEIESAVVLAPPGAANLARHLLDLLHYLRVEELNAAGAQLLIIGLFLAAFAMLAAGATASRLRALARPASLFALLFASSLFLFSCTRSDPGASAPRAISASLCFGEVGRSPGQFIYPRAIDCDSNSLWIIDKSGRIQRFSPDAKPLASFMLPAIESGFPCGCTFAPDGLLYVADTHQHRVLVYDPQSPTLQIPVAQWGAYGTAPGEFYYPTDVAIIPGPDGRTPDRIYVSEYGGNDRINCFDREHQFLFSFGSEGSSSAPDKIQFSRPQSVVYDPIRRCLFVSDAANHRIGRFTPDGALIKWLGKNIASGSQPGAGPGEFNYPYGLALLSDSSLLIAEFGGNRVQRIDPETGACLGLFGVAGRGPGELAYPWGVTVLKDQAYVLDSGNNRTLAFDPFSQHARITPPARAN